MLSGPSKAPETTAESEHSQRRREEPRGEKERRRAKDTGMGQERWETGRRGPGGEKEEIPPLPTVLRSGESQPSAKPRS